MKQYGFTREGRTLMDLLIMSGNKI
jgi:hypothetical protein